jgi:hypothetical protein
LTNIIFPKEEDARLGFSRTKVPKKHVFKIRVGV